MITIFFYLALPVFIGYCLIRYLRLRSDQHHHRLMKQIAENLNLNHSDTRIFDRMMLTLDREDNTLLYISNYDGISYKTISLDKVTSCQLIMKDICIQLEFFYQEAYRPSDTVIFYQKYLHSNSKRRKLFEQAKDVKREIMQIMEGSMMKATASQEHS